MQLHDVLSLEDFERKAHQILPRPLFAYVSGHSEEGQSYRANRAAFADLELVSRVLVDVTRRDTSSHLLGHRYNGPFGIAPMGLCALSAYEGDLVMARAAHEANTLFVLSGSSLTPLEAVAAACPTMWFQAYFGRDTGERRRLMERVRAAGVQTLVITVDTPVAANRENNLRAGFSSPLRPSARLAWQGLSHPRWLLGTLLRTVMKSGMPHFENTGGGRGAPAFSSKVSRDFSERGCLSWTDIDEIRRQWPDQLVLKGILSVRDARMAQAAGVDAIVLSNHGGRQLDGAAPALRVLEPIVQTCGPMPVLIDGGVRRGTDVLKALALGATHVLVGRPFCFAAVTAGERGVAHAIELLASEVSRDMALLGLCSLRELDGDVLLRAGGKA